MSTSGSRSGNQGIRISTLDSGKEFNRRRSRISFFKLSPGLIPEEVPLLNKTASVLIRPLRAFEFITLMFLFIHVMYITATNPKLISYFMTIVLIALTGSYLFMSAIDLIAQYSDNRLRVFPNTMFAACGILFYSIFAIGLLVFKTPTFWLTAMVIALCFLLAILYIIDVVLILLFWKRTCASCDICNHDCSRKYEPPEQTYPSNPEPPSQQRTASLKPSVHCQCTLPEPARVDLATSVSDVEVTGPNGMEADHSFRRVSYARRRQYVDSPTNARSAPALDTAQVQTQASAMTTIEAQTTRSELEEKTVQTLSKCELCHRQLDIYDSPRSPPPPPQAYPTCPAFVQLLRGSPYYTGVSQPAACRCLASVVQVQQHGQHQQDTPLQRGMDQQIQLVQCVDPNLCGTLTNAETKQLGGPEGTITKVTFCIKSNNKTQCASQTMPYESAYTISPVASPLPSPKSRQSSGNRESPNRRLTSQSQKSGKEDVEQDENDPPLEVLHQSIAKSGGRKWSGDNAVKKLQSEITGRRSSVEESARKSIAKSPIRKSTGEGAVRKSILENSAKDCAGESTKKAAESGPRRSTRQSLIRKLEGETFVAENVSRKSAAESEKLRRESMSPSLDGKLVQGRKSDLEIKMTPRTSEVTRSKSHIELRALEREPSILSLSRVAFKGEKEKKPMGCAEGGPCAIMKSDFKPEQRIESQTKSSDLEELSETEENTYNPVVQVAEIEEVPPEEWARKFQMESQTYWKPIIEETDSFSNLVLEERLIETYRKTVIDSESFTKPVLRDITSDTYRKPITEELDTYQKSLGVTKDTTAQTIESILSPSNKQKKGHLFQRRNKIDPMNIIPLEEGESPEYYEQPMHDKFTQEETLFDRRGEDICPTCHRPKPAPGQSAFHYYHIFRDKRGQIFCETCASPNTVKVMHKQLNSQKRLKCVGCGNFIQYKSVQARQSMTPNNSGEVCPTCGRP